MTQIIRFAPIVRISSEKGTKKGESLNTQKKQIMEFVEMLGGKIPEECWRYSGKEQVTSDQERGKLERLLKDSEKGIFDAVIVCDASRWSKDNPKSKQGLAILKSNGIRFFVGATEYDLADPTAELILGEFAKFNQFHAREHARKSISNRIERAKQGIPTSGKLPYGRLYDKKFNSWTLDKKKADSIVWAAEEYLNGKPMSKIARTLGMNHSNLWKILTRRSGDQWVIRFKKTDLGIDETVTITIPPLLSDETIETIKQKAEANKTYTHGHIKNRYLLSRMIFCGHCGYAMFGQTNHSTIKYYRHSRDRKIDCRHPRLWVRAEEVEHDVFMHLFCVLENIPEHERAIEQAIPNKMSYADKRRLVELALGGNDLNGDRYGVYVKKNSKDSVSYVIKGNLPNLNFKGNLPVSDLKPVEVLEIDDQYRNKSDVKDELKTVKQNLFSKVVAHNRFGFHRRDE